MDNIIRKIQELYPVSHDSLRLLKYYFKQQTFPAKTIIIQAGRFDNQVYFIEKGITRSYILHNGKEITTWFSIEGDATCGSWDLYRHKAGFEYVETLEETLTYSISIDKLNDLYKSRIDIANWMRVLQQENFLLLQDIHISRLNLSAQEPADEAGRRPDPAQAGFLPPVRIPAAPSGGTGQGTSGNRMIP